MSLKFEVGKTYVDRDGKKIEIVYKSPYDERARYLGVYSNVDNSIKLSSWYLEEDQRIVKEYKNPVVHKRELIWWKTQDGRVLSGVYPVGQKLYGIELKRETIEYVEEG